MRLSVLGPLSVTGEDGTQVRLTGIKPQLVLAKLLLARNRVVPLLDLINLLWGSWPPRSAKANMYGYLTTVRRWVGPERLRYSHSGYSLALTPGELDLDCFLELRSRGLEVRKAGDVPEAARLWERALSLWRGEPLAGIASEHLSGQLSELSELRTSTMEDFLDAEISLGRAGDLIAELHRLVTDHPLRERLHGIYMRALYAAGRQADALRAYQTARSTLIEELAVEPGPALQRLHLAVLDGDLGALDLPMPTVTREEFSPLCQLPAAATDFVDSTGLLSRLEERLRDSSGLEVLALSGMPGAGKTTLAVQLAHQVRALFPDGQLFVALTTPYGKPRNPSDVLAELLGSLGVAKQAMPDGLEQLATAFRARIADRKILLVLDDAGYETQIRPLLPGTAGSAVVITGRRQLLGLTGAHQVSIDVLGPGDAARLFISSAGAHRVGNEDQAVNRIADLCGGLPLALRLAAARLLARPDWTTGDLADQLAEPGRDLDLLEVGDLTLRASFERSYDGLTKYARLVLRRLAHSDAPHLASWVVNALVGARQDDPDGHGDRALNQLVRASLVQPLGVDRFGHYRYRIHRLLRSYLRERAAIEEPDPDVTHRLAQAVSDRIGVRRVRQASRSASESA